MTETLTIERTYYYDMGENGIYPDNESMIAFLLDEGILFVGNDYGNGTVNLYININDYFAPAADAENLPTKDIPKLFDMYRKDSCDGVAQYVADKRGIPNKRWKDRHKELMQKVDDKMKENLNEASKNSKIKVCKLQEKLDN